MMHTTVDQPYILAAMMYAGILIGILYDLLHVFVRRKGNILKIIADVVFVIFSLGIIAIVSYSIVNIQPRVFHFLGIAIGFAIYRCGIRPVKEALQRKLSQKGNNSEKFSNKD